MLTGRRSTSITIFVPDDDGSAIYVQNDLVDRVFREAGCLGVPKRASNVYPTEAGWMADLTLVGGPLLGPYDDREEAINDEVTWLQGHLDQIPKEFFDD